MSARLCQPGWHAIGDPTSQHWVTDDHLHTVAPCGICGAIVQRDLHFAGGLVSHVDEVVLEGDGRAVNPARRPKRLVADRGRA